MDRIDSLLTVLVLELREVGGHIEKIVGDQWFRIDCVFPHRELRLSIQCDRLEDGIAGTLVYMDQLALREYEHEY